MISRRRWLAGAGAAFALPVVRVLAQGKTEVHQDQRRDSGNLFAMDQEAARTVRLAPKPGAAPSMTADERDALEHRLRCQCGCTLDVFTCRTTDFSCQVSPAMHRDISAAVQGGYTGQEIIDAFVKAYGDRVLMAPPKVGFNVVGYVLPGLAMATGAIVIALVIRGLRPVTVSASSVPIDATPDEMKRIDAAVRDDS